MYLATATTLLFMGKALASPLDIEERQSNCPNIHIFGARETTAPVGYGTAGVVVNLVLNAYPGSTAEAISYPACGGQSSCGGLSYGNSALAGVKAVASAVNSFNSRCPNTILVIVGYSQGGQIFDDAFCGGGDTNIGLSDASIPIQASAVNKIVAAIFMGDPRHIPGLSYNVGTCNANGFAPRPSGFKCPSPAKIQSYCDSTDPYCCNGSDANSHQQYGNKYGQAALTFIKGKISAAGTGGGTNPTTTTTTRAGSTPTATTTPENPSGSFVEHYAQCGGAGYSGATTCASPWTCKAQSQYYSQCL
ncbi:probable acetyl xylan esterase (Axe1) [Rhynchosporium agropyri]|uniref:Probable acetyl xylan esterase (Axe1) n=1 Tax=Rhynchosporium agropyri TaxID=914238 RepID=A0A1E1JWF4_9HELO|nr:probable acetyl xylan esterase (Axe1) [Rhynchosporium agropyri]